MNIIFCLKGILIGIAIAAPVGPIGILCINKTLSAGKLKGFIAGLGATLADTLYGFIAAFGISFLSDFFLTHHIWFRTLGSIILCLVGTDLFFINPHKKNQPLKNTDLHLGTFGISFLITATNPLTIVAFLAIYAILDIGNNLHSLPETLLLTTGIAIGALCWWSTLCNLTSFFRQKITVDNLLWLNKVSGCLIILIGIGAFITLWL